MPPPPYISFYYCTLQLCFSYLKFPIPFFSSFHSFYLFSLPASTAVATSLPPGTGTAPLEPITTPAASTHQTDSDLLNTGTLTPAASTHQTDSGLLNTGTLTPPALVATQTIPQSTLIPVSTQTTQQSPPESVPEKTTLKMTSLPPIPTQGLLTSEAPQTPVQLSVAPAKQDDPPQLDVGDEGECSLKPNTEVVQSEIK